MSSPDSIVFAVLVAGVASVIVAGVMLFFGIQIYAYLWLLFDGLRLHRTLAKKGRTISLEEAAKRISNKEGILIVDAPTLGWNVSRIWWSSDRSFLPRTLKTEEDEFCPPEDPINYDRFIDPSKGCAKLVTSFIFSQKLKEYLKEKFHIEECPFIFTGGVLFSRNPPKK